MEFRETISKEEFLQRIYNRGKSIDAKDQANTAVNKFNEFLKYLNINPKMLNKESERGIANLLSEFATEMRKKVKSTTVKPYMTQVRKYLKFCFNIRINDDDYRDYVMDNIEPDDDDFELYPFSNEELRTIIENIPNQKRRAKYMVSISTGARTAELLKLQAKDFDFSGKFVRITIRKSTSKGRQRKRYGLLVPEANKYVSFVKKLEPEDNVFSTNLTNSKGAKNNERNSWTSMLRRIYKQTNDPKWIKKQGNRMMINPHSIRAFTKIQILLATNNSEFADIYVGHKSKRSNPTYTEGLKQSEDFEKLFEKCIARLSIFENYQVIEQSDERVDKLQREVHDMQILLWQIQNKTCANPPWAKSY